MSQTLDQKIQSLSQEDRYRIINYIFNTKKLKPKDLGITPSYKYKLLKKQKPITNQILKKALKHLTAEDIIKIGINLNPHHNVEKYGNHRGRSLAWENAGLGRLHSQSGDIHQHGYGSYDLSHMTESYSSIPFSEFLIEGFENWVCKRVRDLNTARNYVRYLKSYGYILNEPRQRRVEILMSLPPRKRGWVLDALSNYGKYLDTLHDTSEDFSFYELIRRRLRGIKRERTVPEINIPKLRDLIKFYKSLKDPRAEIYFNFRIFSGLRHRDLMKIEISKFELDPGSNIAYQIIGKLEQHKRSLICLIPLELLKQAEERKIEKVTMRHKRLYESWRRAREETGITIEPNQLRKFNATWLITHGLSREEVDIIQGRSLRKIIALTHYIDQIYYILTEIAPKYRKAIEPLINTFLK